MTSMRAASPWMSNYDWYGNDEYVIATVTALEAQGVRDAPLHRLAALLHGEGALHRHA